MTPDISQAAFLAGGICRLAVAGILAHSAWQALRDPGAHTQAVAGYRLLPHFAVAPASFVLPVLNGLAALLLVAPARSQTGALLGAVLIGLFTAAIFINLSRGRLHIECGCGGAQGQRISTGLLVRNLMLLAPLAVGYLAPVAGALDAATVIGVAGGAGGVAALYFTASQLLANNAALHAGGTRA